MVETQVLCIGIVRPKSRATFRILKHSLQLPASFDDNKEHRGNPSCDKERRGTIINWGSYHDWLLLTSNQDVQRKMLRYTGGSPSTPNVLECVFGVRVHALHECTEKCQMKVGPYLWCRAALRHDTGRPYSRI